MNNLINIFTAPGEVFKNLNEKPTWLLPFLLAIIFMVGFQYVTLDITMDYQLKVLETRDMPEAQYEASKTAMSGPMKYIGMIAGPIFIPIIWVIFALLLFLFSKITISEGIDFKKAFSIVSWSSVVTLLSMVLLAIIILSKGTMHGVALDLSAILETPAIGESKSVLYRLFTKIDPFIIWYMYLWALGLSIMGKVDIKKAAIPVVLLWGLWVLVSVSLGGFFEQFGM